MYRIIFLLFLFPSAGVAQLQLASIFSGNMLLQREQPIPVWGRSAPGSTVTVSFGGEIRSCKTKPDSSWIVYLRARKANAHPQSLLVSDGNSKIVLQNIIIGDVWLCIGQSNMEFPVMREMHYTEEQYAAQQPLLRFYNPSYAGKNIYAATFTDSVSSRLNKHDFYKGSWQLCDTSSIKTMSAVAYYFGKEVSAKTTVPVGLINLSIGGAPLETFIDKKVLKNSRQFAAKINGDWLLNDALPVWIRERGRQNIGAIQDVAADENGKAHAYKPGFAWDAGIAALLPMPVKGIICYQGESNAQEIERVNEYAALLQLMVNDYRAKWKQPCLPFNFVQLSSIDTVKYNGKLWPQFRDAQRKILQQLRCSGMAVCSDIGARDDVHPLNKKEVGERLARWALNKTYHLNTVPSGPLPLNARYANAEVVIAFSYQAAGLHTAGNAVLQGFSLDGKNNAQAFIRNGTVVIPAAVKPPCVYYGWKPYSDGNLINSENLPASGFKIEVQ